MIFINIHTHTSGLCRPPRGRIFTPHDHTDDSTFGELYNITYPYILITFIFYIYIFNYFVPSYVEYLRTYYEGTFEGNNELILYEWRYWASKKQIKAYLLACILNIYLIIIWYINNMIFRLRKRRDGIERTKRTKFLSA